MERIPKIRSVAPIEDGRLLVCFENGVEEIYGCKPLMTKPEFSLLKDLASLHFWRKLLQVGRRCADCNTIVAGGAS